MTSQQREHLRELVHRILGAVAPEETDIATLYLDPLMQMAQRDQLVTVDRGEHAGGFGGVDLLLVVIVPLALQLLHGNDRDQKGKGRITLEQVLQMAHATGSTRGLHKAREIAEAFDRWLRGGFP